MNKPDYQVIVSNVGTVYSGNWAAEARLAYEEAKADSANVIGRSAGEDVTLMYKGEPTDEYIGVISQGTQEESKECDCPAHAVARAIEAISTGKESELPARDIVTLLVASVVEKLGRVPSLTITTGKAKTMHKAIMKAIADHSDMR